MARIHRSQPQTTFCPLIGIVVGVLATFIDERGKIWQMIEHLIQSESCPIARSSTQADADDLTIRDLGLLKLKGKLKPWLLQISSSGFGLVFGIFWEVFQRFFSFIFTREKQ